MDKDDKKDNELVNIIDWLADAYFEKDKAAVNKCATLLATYGEKAFAAIALLHAETPEIPPDFIRDVKAMVLSLQKNPAPAKAQDNGQSGGQQSGGKQNEGKNKANENDIANSKPLSLFEMPKTPGRMEDIPDYQEINKLIDKIGTRYFYYREGTAAFNTNDFSRLFWYKRNSLLVLNCLSAKNNTAEFSKFYKELGGAIKSAMIQIIAKDTLAEGISAASKDDYAILMRNLPSARNRGDMNKARKEMADARAEQRAKNPARVLRTVGLN
ncbi:MAG: hypothetical protein NT051_01315 [Candidatus Micrarchaeota archaeon]|nr:hypothetical protein [Candidatus Micrarchaeota archaeon]